MGGKFGDGYAGHKDVHYLFIDGEQLRCTAEEVGNDWFGKPIELDYVALQQDCQKVFYYDCLPAKPHHTEAEPEYQAKRDAKLRFFNELRKLPGWHVSEGLAKHRRRERQQQKEVDILIAVDMLTHTYRKNMHRLTFISGDQDFAPLLEAVVRDGMYVELLYPEGRTAADLMHFADVANPMDVDFLHRVSTDDFKRHNALPVFFGADVFSSVRGDCIGEALKGGVSYAKVWREHVTEGGNIRIQTVDPHGASRMLWCTRDRDDERARRYFTMRMERDYGLAPNSLEWKTCP